MPSSDTLIKTTRNSDKKNQNLITTLVASDLGEITNNKTAGIIVSKNRAAVTNLSNHLICIHLGDAASDNVRMIFKRRDKRTAGSQHRADLHGQNSSQLNDILTQYNHQDLLQYTPRAPSPENVNCHVEVPVTQRVGGRCIPLGNHFGCQAGMYLAFSSECQPYEETVEPRNRVRTNHSGRRRSTQTPNTRQPRARRP